MNRLLQLIVFLCAFVIVTGCQNLGYSNMSAEQIKATNGTTTCTQYSGLYGKASAIALNQDDIRKGNASRGKIVIGCGDATMSIEAETAPAAPAGATVTTTTVTKPAGSP